MQVLPDQLLRKSLKIKNSVPVYYISFKLIEELANRKKMAALLDGENFSENFLNHRPFDEVVIIANNLDRYEIVHYLADGTFRNFSNTNGMEITNQTVRERFAQGKMDIKKDQKRLEENKLNAQSLMLPFAIKKNRIVLAEGRTVKTGKKGKIKKQKYIYVTSSTYEAVKNGVDTHMSYSVHSVAGHIRRYEKNPDTNGHDRNGSEVKGWTWVRPYVTGEGLEIMEKIRMWK